MLSTDTGAPRSGRVNAAGELELVIRVDVPHDDALWHREGHLESVGADESVGHRDRDHEAIGIEATGRELRKVFAWNASNDDDYVDGEVAR